MNFLNGLRVIVFFFFLLQSQQSWAEQSDSQDLMDRLEDNRSSARISAARWRASRIERPATQRNPNPSLTYRRPTRHRLIVDIVPAIYSSHDVVIDGTFPALSFSIFHRMIFSDHISLFIGGRASLLFENYAVVPAFYEGIRVDLFRNRFWFQLGAAFSAFYFMAEPAIGVSFPVNNKFTIVTAARIPLYVVVEMEFCWAIEYSVGLEFRL